MPVYFIGYNAWSVMSPTATTATQPYYYWVSDIRTTATTATIWLPSYSSTGTVWVASRPYIARGYQQTEDDLRQYYRMHEARQRRQLERHTAEASAKSLDLLRAHLSPAQQESFEKNKFFVIEGGLSKQRYRINATRHMVANIDVLDNHDGKEVRLHRLCGHCDLAEVPLYDQLLAQKMMLEFDEERFLKLANRHAA